ncbi:hypothetical protein J6590_035189 [Homalodisca vitripennis]|nr:hypothetical protein J6590_035189 [Homalodisca vitripennis]
MNEGTLMGIARDDGVNFQLSDSGSENPSETNESDADITFDPEQPSTSALQPRSKRPLMSSRPRVSQDILTSEVEEDETPSRPNVIEQRFGRPKNRQNVVQQNDPAETVVGTRCRKAMIHLTIISSRLLN